MEECEFHKVTLFGQLSYEELHSSQTLNRNIDQWMPIYLALGTLLGISLPMFNFISPMTQQLVSLFVLFAVDTFMPRRMALKTPYKLASWAPDLWEEEHKYIKHTTIWEADSTEND